ncbi:MFS transporter [Flexibacterium corallicola]|uniref:MFS transporter n=1 Tax=Flexibacterium corallicola TaxID=3037259 RepID=UPI00286ED1E3|nr:MFS transporter [Pseudovibrio sp. M1P-2-3]
MTPQEKPVWQEGKAIALLLAASLTVMANATISPALPGLAQMFADDKNAQYLTRLLVAAPSLSVIFVAPLAGSIADHYGRRPVLLCGVLLFAIAGSAGLFLPDLNWIFASRLLLGVAVGMIMSAQTALVGDYYTGAKRSSLMGLQISARNFGGFVYISLAGWLALSSPRFPFAVYALALLFLPFIWRVLTEPVKHKAGQPQGDPQFYVGHKAWVPLFVALCVLQMLTNMSFFVMPTQLPFFFESLGVESAGMTGMALGTLMICGGTSALLYSSFRAKLGLAGVYALGYGLMALGLVTVASPLPYSPFIAAALVGAGYALVMPSFTALALQLSPSTRRGIVGGWLTTSVFFGQFISPFLTMPLIASLGFGGAFTVIAGGLAILAIGAFAVRVFNALSERKAGTASA